MSETLKSTLQQAEESTRACAMGAFILSLPYVLWVANHTIDKAKRLFAWTVPPPLTHD